MANNSSPFNKISSSSWLDSYRITVEPSTTLACFSLFSPFEYEASVTAVIVVNTTAEVKESITMNKG
jgi:hypothetical protein